MMGSEATKSDAAAIRVLNKGFISYKCILKPNPLPLSKGREE